MFIFYANVLLKNFRLHLHKHYEILTKYKKGVFQLNNYLINFQHISFDNEVKGGNIDLLVTPEDLGWNDVGSFNVFDSVFSKIENRKIAKRCSLHELNSHDI